MPGYESLAMPDRIQEFVRETLNPRPEVRIESDPLGVPFHGAADNPLVERFRAEAALEPRLVAASVQHQDVIHPVVSKGGGVGFEGQQPWEKGRGRGRWGTKGVLPSLSKGPPIKFVAGPTYEAVPPPGGATQALPGVPAEEGEIVAPPGGAIQAVPEALAEES